MNTRWPRIAKLALAGAVLVLMAAELVCRLALGLGDPPLSISDPEIEYMFKPSASYRRFGNSIRYNAYSMRSDAFPKRKADPSEIRVLVIGDSVVNGGVQTDQSELATTRLQSDLASRFGKVVHVGNISAGSWGPPNQLAYMKRYGWFEADVSVLVFSSHDYADIPTFEPTVGVNPDFPDRRPLLAVIEALTRYLPRYLPRQPVPAPPPPTEADIRTSLDAVCELIREGRSSGGEVMVALHLDRSEVNAASPSEGHDMIAERARACGAKVIELGPLFRESLQRGEDPYRDVIHPNALGQRLMVQAIEPWLVEALSKRSSRAAPRQ